jgi:hypothetical protein
MPRRPPPTLTELGVEHLELAAEETMRRQDLQAGLVPGDVRRSLYDHELTARVNFARLDADVVRTGTRLAQVLQAFRAALLALVERDLSGSAPFGGLAVARRMLELEVRGPDSILGGGELVEATVARAVAEAEAAAVEGAVSVRAEAAAQGVGVPAQPGAPLPAEARATVELATRRSVLATAGDTLRALRDAAVQLAPGSPGPDVVMQLVAAGRDLSPAVVEGHARTAAASADGLGRQAGVVGLAAPAAVYASELLDRNTCGPCSLVDGKQYADLAAARLDYPGGIYRACEGGLRCRGTLVFVWPTETPPTIPAR